MQDNRGRERAVTAVRADPGEEPNTAEIDGLAEAAGYEVVGSVSQSRPEDPGTNLGAGKVGELVELVEATGADAVVVDNALTPAQTLEIGDRLPEETELYDRYRLVLTVFAEQAGDRRAKLQVELARLQYELPRIERDADPHLMSLMAEKGHRAKGARDRIEELKRKLDRLTDEAARHRERRREEGFDLVALAGYTNAGKSTLLHRLADDLDVDELGAAHDDVAETAAVEDRLFKTLETTTRRATLDDRRVMLTDTVGFVADLPHDLVESFSATLDEVGAADVVVLVADASQPTDRLRERLETARTVIDEAEADEVVVALNKVDRVDPAVLAERREAVADLAPDPVETSALDGAGVDELRAAVRSALPSEHAALSVPGGDDAMALVSWAYDNCEVLEVTYGDRVEIELAGRPDVVDRARGKARAAGGQTR